MKMKEVCERTGLTERTVRFYTKQDLVYPNSTETGGRLYLDYSEDDVNELMTIADLRKLYFSLREIKEMKESPTKIADILIDYKKNLDSEVKSKESILKSLEKINYKEIDDVHYLAESLKNVSSQLQLPKRDVNPDFDRFDQESKDIKRKKYKDFEMRQLESYIVGKLIIYIIVCLHFVFSTLITVWTELNLIAYLLLLALGAALYLGITWVRYVFIIGAIASLFFILRIFIGDTTWSLSTEQVIFLIIYTIYSVIIGILLSVHSGIKEYEYSQKIGK